MKPKNAIIILIIVTVVAATAVYFIYQNLQSGKKVEPTTQPVVKELTPEERRQAAIKLMEEVEKNNPTITTDPVEKERRRQAAIKLMAEVEKNNPIIATNTSETKK